MRLIDADALHNVFERYRNAPHVRMRNGVSEGMRMVINSCIEFLDNEKTIDVVEVVRCKDCKHLMFSDMYGECGRGYLGIVQPNDFCCHGERKEE